MRDLFDLLCVYVCVICVCVYQANKGRLKSHGEGHPEENLGRRCSLALVGKSPTREKLGQENQC